jgi:hypothetical protein
MRIIACTVILCAAVPVFAQHTLKQDFRGSKFDLDLMAYSGQTPEKYITLENEGLRLRYTGEGAPPTNNTAGVAWRFHARGDFVVTARYEILKAEQPKNGWAVGAELYLRVKNPTKDGISFARIIHRDGVSKIAFSYLTTAENGKRVPRDPKDVEATDGSLRGAFRLAREDGALIASFAEGDGEFREFQRTTIGVEDIDLIRFAGLGGGDPNAVLDMRMLEFNLQGRDLGYKGKDFATPAPKAVPPANLGAPLAQIGVPVQPPAADPVPAAKTNLLLLVGVLFVLVIPLILIGATVLFLRLRNSRIAVGDAPSKKPASAAKSVENKGNSAGGERSHGKPARRNAT